ncbi:MAG: peptidoglycan-associated lipoprotein Pal [Candidatus Zixiibacteriota bacterium]
MKKYLVLFTLLTFALLVTSCGKKPAVESEMGDSGTETMDNGNTGGEGNTDIGDQVKPDTPLDFVTIYFDFDKYNLREDAKSGLKNNYEVMQERNDAHIQIEGHCDERGTVEYNLALGEKRARSAMEYLASLGIPRDRMSIISYGKERPAVLGSNEDAWAKNRRAEFVTK